MEEFLVLIFVTLFVINSLNKAESVKLEEAPLKTFDEIFGEGWWDKDETEDLKMPPTNFGQNVHHQIGRQNTKLGQIEPNSTDQNPPLTESDHSGRIESNSTDQNPPLTESDHSDNAKNGEEQNQLIKEMSSNEKRKIVAKFHAMKDEFKQKGKFPYKERTKMEAKIAKHLKTNRTKIYEWKKEFGLSRKMHNFGKTKNDQKILIAKFDQRKAELKRAGFKNSQNELDKTVAKELGFSFMTIYRWKCVLGQIESQHKQHSHSEQKELMKLYYKTKGKNPKIRDENIAKMLNIGKTTLYKWKKQFKQQQLHPNSVVGHSVKENSGSNVQDIENSNSASV